jgi:PAS domain S-box-containing protein
MIPDSLLMRVAFDAMVTHDLDRIVDANSAAVALSGYQHDELIGMRIADFVPAAQRDELMRVVRSGDPARREWQIVRKDGGLVPVEARAEPYDDGRLRVVALRDLRERKALRVTDEKFRMICHAAFDAVLVHDRGTIIEASEKCYALFGYAAGDLVGRSILELNAPETHEELLRRIDDASNEPHQSIGVRVDGSRFSFEACGVTLNDSTLRVVALRDLTSRQRAEEELRATADRYRDLVENSHDLICTHELTGKILSANPAAGRALGVKPQDLIGGYVQDLLFPAGLCEFESYIETILRDGVANGTMVVRAANGSRRTWQYRNTLRTDGVDAPIVRGIARDVTDSEEANRALRWSEDHFRSIIENVSDFISIIETTGVIGYSSPSVHALLGWKPDEIVGTPFIDLVHAEEAASAASFFDEHVRFDAPAGRISLRLRDCIGAYRSFEVVTKTIVQGARSAIVATARDITDRVLLEKQLEQANRLTSLGRLAATVAHEFNNVLMGMLPFSELMQRPSISHEASAKAAWHIATSISRGKRIVQEILRYTRPAEPDLRPVDIAEWWKNFGREMSAQTANDIRICAEMPPLPLCVLADASQLSQVIANLIANARDAMPHGGTITLRAEPAGNDGSFSYGVVTKPENYAHIAIEDTGNGITQEVINHIFEPLFTTKQNGTGLGLAIAHQVITRHDGYLFVESHAGHGTAFHIFLPTVAKAAPPPVEVPRKRQLATRRLLIVEDEEAIADGIGNLLEESSIEVISVALGEEAIDAVERFNPDIVVMDVGLPGIDGIEAYHRLREHGLGVPVIFSTGHGDRRKLADLSSDRLTRFLQKPFEINELLDTIGSLESEKAETC